MSICFVSCVFEENFEEFQFGLITFSLYLKREEHLFNDTVNATETKKYLPHSTKILNKNGLSVICVM